MESALRGINNRPAHRNKIFFCLLTLLILNMLVGCMIERKVQNNQFYSSYPKVKIDVDKNFVHLGSGAYVSKLTYASMEYDYFYFIPKDNSNQTLSKGIIIELGVASMQYSHNNMTFYTVIDDKSKYVIRHSKQDVNDKSYEYFTVMPSIPVVPEITKFLKSKNYIQPRCALTQVMISSGNQTFRYIKYFEDVALSGLECSLWADKNKLTENQKKYIDEFTLRADRAFQIIDF